MTGTAIPTEAEIFFGTAIGFDCLEVRKYCLGEELGHDPGWKLAKEDFFEKYYERVKREFEVDVTGQTGEITRRVEELKRDGTIAKLIREGKLEDVPGAIRNYAAQDFIRDGREEYVKRRRSMEGNNLREVSVQVRRLGTTDLNDLMEKCGCDVFVEDKRGEIRLSGKNYVRLAEAEVDARYGHRINVLLYGDKLHLDSAQTRLSTLERDLGPIPSVAELASKPA